MKNHTKDKYLERTIGFLFAIGLILSYFVVGSAVFFFMKVIFDIELSVAFIVVFSAVHSAFLFIILVLARMGSINSKRENNITNYLSAVEELCSEDIEEGEIESAA